MPLLPTHALSPLGGRDGVEGAGRKGKPASQAGFPYLPAKKDLTRTGEVTIRAARYFYCTIKMQRIGQQATFTSRSRCIEQGSKLILLHPYLTMTLPTYYAKASSTDPASPTFPKSPFAERMRHPRFRGGGFSPSLHSPLFPNGGGLTALRTSRESGSTATARGRRCLLLDSLVASWKKGVALLQVRFAALQPHNRIPGAQRSRLYEGSLTCAAPVGDLQVTSRGIGVKLGGLQTRSRVFGRLLAGAHGSY